MQHYKYDLWRWIKLERPHVLLPIDRYPDPGEVCGLPVGSY